MLAERRVVVLREVDKLKKGARALLEPVPRTAGARHRARAGRAEWREVRQDAEHSRDGRRVQRPSPATVCHGWVSYHAQHTLGRSITPEAVTLLIEAVGGDLAQLAVELEKLASYSHRGQSTSGR
jgi:hypothetical protein